MTSTHLELTPRANSHKSFAQPQWRQAIASILHHWADRILPAPAVAQSHPHTGFVSHREDVRAWCAALSPAARSAVGSDRAMGKLQGIVHRLRYLPHEETLVEFVQLVPDWEAMHRDFASYLLRRLVTLRHTGRQPDATFGLVHEWLRERNQALTQVPYPWSEAVDAANARLGPAGKSPLRTAVRAPAHDLVRRAVGA